MGKNEETLGAPPQRRPPTKTTTKSEARTLTRARMAVATAMKKEGLEMTRLAGDDDFAKKRFRGTCCCCCPLKCGNITLVVYLLVGSLASLMLTLSGKVGSSGSVLFWFDMVSLALFIPLQLAGLYGFIKERRKFVAAYLCSLGLLYLRSIVVAIWFTMEFGGDNIVEHCLANQECKRIVDAYGSTDTEKCFEDPQCVDIVDEYMKDFMKFFWVAYSLAMLLWAYWIWVVYRFYRQLVQRDATNAENEEKKLLVGGYK